MCVCVCERTDSQVGDEEVGDGAERLEAVDDVDDQRIAENAKNDDGAVGQDQHHLGTRTQAAIRDFFITWTEGRGRSSFETSYI